MSSLVSPPTPDEYCTLFRNGTKAPFRIKKKYCSEDLKLWIEEGKTKDVRLTGPLYMPTVCDWCGTDTGCMRNTTVRGHGDWHISKSCPACEPGVAEWLRDILGKLVHIPVIDGKETPVKVQRSSGAIELCVVGSLLPKQVPIEGVKEYCLKVFQFCVWQNEGMHKWVPVRTLEILNFTQPDGTVHYGADGNPVQNLDTNFNPLLLDA